MSSNRLNKKVIVIGLDGLEPKIVEPMLQAGALPTLASLRARGGYSRLQTTFPAQTPVAWSTFATGTNPGGHGVFDFIARDPKTYFPILALNHYEQKHPFLPPRAVNGRRGTPLWELLSKAGISSTVLRHPLTYPPDTVRGRMLAGVGVPDLRGGLGTSTFYTTAENVETQEGETVLKVRAGTNNRVDTHIIGPRNPSSRTDLTLDVSLQLDTASKKIILRSAGMPGELDIRLGEWSDWLKVKFRVNSLVSVRGMLRFFLVRFEPALELYASPINFDPAEPLYPISSPPEYARELAVRFGSFYTAGMAEEDGGLKNRRIGEEAFLAQCEHVLREREAMMLFELERLHEGFLFCLFDTPDRLQHLFWRFGEPDHPANRDDVTPEMGRVIGDHYRRLDAIVGKAAEYADDQTLFIVLSDHGMNSFQRGLNLNTWLHANGLLTLKAGIEPGKDAGDFLRTVDWSRTKAYALGLGGVYLNLKGRESHGILDAHEAEVVQAAIVQGLAGLIDSTRGKTAVRRVVTREQVYRGPFAHESPDLLVNFSEGYRASWGTALGGVPAGLFEDNVKKWGGDHVIDPDLVPGVLFMSRSIHRDSPRMTDLAPTILAAFGAPKGPSMEGDSLLE